MAGKMIATPIVAFEESLVEAIDVGGFADQRARKI